MVSVVIVLLLVPSDSVWSLVLVCVVLVPSPR